MYIKVHDHPDLDIVCFVSNFSAPLGSLITPPAILRWFDSESEPPIDAGDDVKTAIRDLLRHDGFKPTGRSKPASEYLLKAVEKGWFGPNRGINLAVDTCNVVSLHSGLPISVIDVELTSEPLQIARCPANTSYVFNPTGQIIDVSGLLSLHDLNGPCAGPIKDSQRTKTHDLTRTTLSVIWGSTKLPGQTQRALDWYIHLLEDAGASIRVVGTTTD